MKRRIVLLPMLLLTAVALAACGSKGPLVAPNQKPAAAKKKPAPPPQTPPPPVQPAADNGTQQ